MPYQPEYDSLEKEFVIVDYSPSYPLGDFSCCIPEYNGSYMLWLAIGFADYLLESIGCRFLTVDADTEYDPKLPNSI